MGVNKCIACEYFEDSHPRTKICVCEKGKRGVHVKDGCELFNPHSGAACNTQCAYLIKYDGGYYHCSYYNKKYFTVQQYCEGHAEGGYDW